MIILGTSYLQLVPEQVLVPGGIVWSTGHTLPDTIALPRRKHTVPCEP